ncbi:MAG: TonB-dependent receptor domain-containing protein, partial [Gammaproteobacteria bacterium]
PHITSFVPTLKAIETVNIVTNSFDAEQGLAGGAAVNVQIKSGTNELRGSIFEYHTNNRLKAKQFFLPAGQRNPKLVVNEFGGTFGGPIKKNKLFYFMSYEGNYDREFAARFGTVPTAAMKAGDMSGSPRLVYDPLTGIATGLNRTPFAGNRIPEARINPITKKLADLTPLPNVPGLLTTFGSNNYFAGAAYSFDRHRADTKMTWSATDKLNVFGRFSLLQYNMNNPEMFGAVGGPEISAAGGNPGLGSGHTLSVTGAVNYVLTPHLIMDAYYGWTHFETNIEQCCLDRKIGLDELGIPGTNGTRRFEGGWPRFSVNSFSPLGIANAFQPYYRRDPQFQYVSNFNWTRGNHEIRFGLDFYAAHMNHLQPEATGASHGAQGGFTFGTGPTSLRGSTTSGNEFNSYATFLLGLPTTIGKITQVPDIYNTRQWNYSWYARDRWNATRKLTLSYGIRWEYFPFPTRADRGLEFYDGAINKMFVCGVGQVPEDCGVEESKKRFAPRVGIAYRASDTLVIRAGYGITNDPFSLQRPLRTNFPVLLIQNIVPPNNETFGWAGRIQDGIPRVTVPDLGNGIIDVPGTFAVITVPKEIGRGYVQSWNFTLQKQLKWGFTGQAGYVATRSTKQLGYLNLNNGQEIGLAGRGQPLLVQFGRTAQTTLITPFGTTQYDSLQASLERRFSRGLQLGMGYTWSKVIGYNTNSDSGPQRTHALKYWEFNRALLDYDRTHNMQITSIWEAPFGKGRRWANGGIGAAILGGWQVNNLLSFMSGTPFQVTASGESLEMTGTTQTADQVKPKVEILGGAGRGLFYFDRSAFVDPRTFNAGRTPGSHRFGTAGIRNLRGPGVVNWDFGVFRTFQVTERWKLEFRMESFNFSNTPHFGNPNGDVNSSNYGQILGVLDTQLGRDRVDERQFRFGLRLSF